MHLQDDLRDQLQASLGDAYTLESELGGGGMSRVFVARDQTLKRQVVVKVLSPELAAGVSHERFRREIELAASLQHPHIVPLLHAGEAGSLLYYTMPVVQGESLRDRIAREGPLPVSDTLRLLRDVLDALAYAHRRGVVHRDIKPGNILLADNHALVTDFGVAKALSASAGGEGGGVLTSVGIALGTPAYMAPEQASADPHTDHRADIYAVGVVAYELLAGVTPFSGVSPQALFVAQLTADPAPVTKHRPATPAKLAALIMRCLEKNPADRWRTADELLQQLDAISATLEHPEALTSPGDVNRPSIRNYRALAYILPIYLLFSVGVFGAVKFATARLGLPDWVVPGAVVLLLIGLPIIAVTALSHVGRKQPATLASSAGTRESMRTLTWRKAILGGVFAFALWGIVVAGYMALRALGIGPVGSLIAAGVLDQRERILIADFVNQTSDSLLGGAATEAFRIDFSQSPVVTVVQPNYVRGALGRMTKPANTPIDLTLAREIAVRDGVKAIIAGEISEAGPRFVVSARLVSAQTGDVLAAGRETAADSSGIIGAIDDLSQTLRERIGESLRTIRENEPLDQVTTASLDALRRYTQGVRAIEVEGDFARGVGLLEEAVALDTTFAMAYRKLGVHLENVRARRHLVVDALTKAYKYRERLTDRERYLAIGSYFYSVQVDHERASAAFRTLLEMYPDDAIAVNNLGVIYGDMRQYEREEEMYQRALKIDSTSRLNYTNLAGAQANLGKLSEVRGTLERAAVGRPDNPDIVYFRTSVLAGVGDYAAAEKALHALLVKQAESQVWIQAINTSLANLALVQGRLSEAEEFLKTAMKAAEATGSETPYLLGAVRMALVDIALRGNPSRGLRGLEQALARHPLEKIEPLDRPYRQIALALALADRPDQARKLIKEHSAAIPEEQLRAAARRQPLAEHTPLGSIAVAEKRYAAAIAEFRAADAGRCRACTLTYLARAYDLANAADSAIAVYERYLSIPGTGRVFPPAPIHGAGFGDGLFLAPTHKRLAELYEERGERDKAAKHYARVVELWKNADPELQPTVTEARRRLANLGGERRQ
ncbi:MAG: protein kinase [Anaerolineae bacterium]|nr:protein kinase [Gemmatimonadaceae bacterium]